jgi:hypothetical protein
MNIFPYILFAGVLASVAIVQIVLLISMSL